jgi:hypothetical protein
MAAKKKSVKKKPSVSRSISNTTGFVVSDFAFYVDGNKVQIRPELLEPGVVTIIRTKNGLDVQGVQFKPGVIN